MKCRIVPIELELKREFVVAGGSASLKRNYICEIDGIGLGEAAGSVHYGATAEEIEKDLHAACDRLTGAEDNQIPSILDSFEGRLCAPASCAMSTAWHDWQAKQDRVALYKHLGLDAPSKNPTSITVSIGDMDSLNDYLKSGYRHIKLKMDAGDTGNQELIEIINRSREVCFRIDANGSWSYDDAVQILKRLNPARVEILEQPFGPNAFEEWKRLMEMTSIPLFMDESIVSAEDVKRVAGYVDGVNIKIQKSGRLETAIEAMKTARRLGLKIMLGCMIESSMGIATAWHLSGLADYIDLDARLLIKDDPFQGLSYDRAVPIIAGNVGHGVSFA
jgi:L-alanine-DL-glutamate epimerase-like enolase superfamily enzyme